MALAALLIMMGVLLHGQAAPLSSGRVVARSANGLRDSALSGFRVFPHACATYLSQKAQGPRAMLCLSFAGHGFSLAASSPPVVASWNETESRRNFEASLPFVVPGNPLASRLLTMPLAAEAGGVAFHPGVNTGPRKTIRSGKPWPPGYAEPNDSSHQSPRIGTEAVPFLQPKSEAS